MHNIEMCVRTFECVTPYRNKLIIILKCNNNMSINYFDVILDNYN